MRGRGEKLERVGPLRYLKRIDTDAAADDDVDDVDAQMYISVMQPITRTQSHTRVYYSSSQLFGLGLGY